MIGIFQRAASLLTAATLSLAVALPEPTGGYANDFAGVLSAETQTLINRESRALEDKTGAQIVVVTVDSLEGSDIESYAVALGRKWGVGDAEHDNGLLLLLAPNERKVRIEVGYGLEGALNDAKTGRLLDQYAVPYFKEDEWDGGIQGVYTALLHEVYREYGVSPPDGMEKPVPAPSRPRERQTQGSRIPVIVLAVIVLAIFSMRRGGGGRGGRSGGWHVRTWGYGPIIRPGGHWHDDDHWGGPGGFGGGGFGGGSGGGFSGGGGGFGGGGGSRDF